MKKKFYEYWKKKSILEQQGIRSLEQGKKLILKHLPKKNIIAIYAKGSLVRREMNQYSDVDTYTILRYSKDIKTMNKLSDNYRKQYQPPIQFSCSSLWELKTNKQSTTRKGEGTSPAAINQHLKHYKLLWGKTPKQKEFNNSTPTRRLKGMINLLEKQLLPQHKKGKFHFHELLKQVFWLIEREQHYKGKETPYHWGKMTKTITNKRHLVHETNKLYFHTPHKTIKQKKEYLKKLERHIKQLKKEIISQPLKE